MSGRHIGERFPSNEAYLETLTRDVLEAADRNPNRSLREVAREALGVISDYTFEDIIRRVHAARKAGAL
jgi:hypothetical protein